MCKRLSSHHGYFETGPGWVSIAPICLEFMTRYAAKAYAAITVNLRALSLPAKAY
jgi:hypothetical protein